VSFMNKNFFFGYQERPDAERILCSSPIKAFLVRISKKQKRFVYSSLHMEPDKHKIIEHEHYVKDGGPILLKYTQENFYNKGFIVASSKATEFK